MAKSSIPTGMQYLNSHTAEETKFDLRLLDKKIQHGFLTKQEREQHLKGLAAEGDYDFTSAAALDAEMPTE